MRWYNFKQNFWRGLYILMNDFELHFHKLTVKVYKKVDYFKVIKDPYTGSERHPFRERR